MANDSQKRESLNSKGNARGMSVESRQNLKPFPAGRPKKEVCVTSWLKEYADTLATKQLDPKTLTYAQLAALQQWRNAVKGDLEAYEFIINRIEGKVIQKVQAETDVTIKYRAEDLTDDRLATIATGSGKGAIAPSVGPVSAN